MKAATLAVAIAALALLVRLPGLGEFMTVDEENWMIRSAMFWDELMGENPGGTFLTTHPGSTAMWLVGAGETLQERRLGFEVDESTLQHFRKAAVAPVVLASVLLIGVIVWLLAQLWGQAAASTAGVLLAADPYLTGMTQIAHLDGLQSLLMLAALLAFVMGLGAARSWPWLLGAGGFLGLALGTKLVLALWLVPVAGAMALWRWGVRRSSWQRTVRALGIIIGTAGLVFFASWPALWVKNDVGYSLTRDIQSVVVDEHVPLSDYAGDSLAAISFYPRTLLGRTPPHVLLLALGAVVVLGNVVVRQGWRWQEMRGWQTAAVAGWLVVYAVGFLAVITLAAKKGDRYALPALVVLPVVAGWAAYVAGQAGLARWPGLRRRQRWLAGILGAAVVAAVLLTPYPIAYNNPLLPNVRPLSQQGWGEGLDQAARWLNEHPLADRLYVASWYPGVLGTYFHGKTLSLSSRDDHRVSYVVTYRNMEGRAPDQQASNVLDEFRDKEPLHTVFVAGVPYVRVYETSTIGLFSKHAGEVVAGVEVGQTVTVPNNAWDEVAIGFATFSGRENTADVVLHVRATPDGPDIRTVRVSAREIVDNEWHTFRFDPITGAAGAPYYIAVTSPNGRAGNAVTVRYVDADVRAGEMYLMRQPLEPGEGRAAFVKHGDIAYRLPE